MNLAFDKRLRTMNDSMCKSLLTLRTVGRLAYNEAGHPMVIPMNFRFWDDEIVMRSDAGAKLDYLSGSPVAFEIDAFDGYGAWGWSVVASGHIEDITDRIDDAALLARDMPVWPLPPGEHEHWLMLKVERVTGRVFGHPPEFGVL